MRLQDSPQGASDPRQVSHSGGGHDRLQAARLSVVHISEQATLSETCALRWRDCVFRGLAMSGG